MRQLREQPQAFSFFEAVRRVEVLNPDQPRIGFGVHPREEPLRFGQNVSLGYANGSIEKVTTDDGQPTPRMMLNFMGLTGPNGPMPLQFTQFTYDRFNRYGDSGLARFLDMFNHRLTALFYKAWSLNEQSVSYDRADHDWFSDYVGSMIGYGVPALKNRDALSFRARLNQAHTLIKGPRNAAGLASIMAGFFDTKAEVRPFQLSWLEIPEQSQCKLGVNPGAARIGENAVVGKRCPSRDQEIELRIGPMKLTRYEALLPGSEGDQQLQAWISSYLPRPLKVKTRVLLDKNEVPGTRLGQYGQLGRTIWTGTKQPERDADQFMRVRQVYPDSSTTSLSTMQRN